MPALIYFRRKWLVACDDLVIPYAIEACLRTIWIYGTFSMIWLENTRLNDSVYIQYFLYALLGNLLVTASLSIGISVTSSKGSVLEVHKRKHLTVFLYIKFVADLVDLSLASYLIWLFIYVPNSSFQWKIFSEAACVCLWGYLFALMIAYFICYNSLGSSRYWNENGRIDSSRILKKVERVWRFRLKFFCCCADVSGDGNDFIYVDIANFLAKFSSDIDLAPTDVLAGLITLSRRHAIERRKINHQENIISYSLLENIPAPIWMTAENALAYLRIAKSTYGWLAFFDTLRPWKLCSLLSPSFTCSNQHSSTKQGDCCNCNTAAIEKITGLPDSDILYASFSTSIHEPAFTITLHHHMKAIVIAIRGTRSISDLITDIDADEISFPFDISSQKIKFHRGALRSTLFIYKKINDLNILRIAFAENPAYTLVLTGHSLGGSIASILGLLLRPAYPSLQCYSYGPLAVVSAGGVSKTVDFVFSVIVGDDMVPRLSVHCCKELFKQLHKSLEETKVPKYKILTKVFLNYIKRILKIPPKVLSRSEVHENRHGQIQVQEECPSINVNIDETTHETQLYAPGRILHLKNGQGCDCSWTTGFGLQRILVSPYMIKDHQPHQIQTMLDKYKSFMDSLENESFSVRL